MRKWHELAEQLKKKSQPHKRDDPEERQWYLLALRRIEQLENAINDRREYVEKQLGLADAAFRAGRPNEALMIRNKLIDQFGKYTDLADLFQPIANLNNSDNNAAPSAPPTSPPSKEPNPSAASKTAADPKESGAQPESAPAGTAEPPESSSSSPPKNSPPES